MPGESENRHKELKRELHGDRLSDHRFLANDFRLLMHALAYPPVADWCGNVSGSPIHPLPRRNCRPTRHRNDPLGEGHISTWRTRLIKVACEVVVSARRIVIRLSSSWPYLDQFRKVAQANAALATT